MGLENGTVFRYRDVDHEGSNYAPYENLSGTYEVVDAAKYPRYVKVRLIAYDEHPNDGTGAILNWDKQESAGLIERL